MHEGLAAETAGGVLAVEVPQRQTVAGHVEVRVRTLLVLQRVDVGHQVPAHTVGVDQFLHACGLGDLIVVAQGDVVGPADRLVGDAQRTEDVDVEVLFAEQQLVDAPQELAALGALDDPVVVGRGQREDLADPLPDDVLLGGALELGRVLHRADPDDDPLAWHQPRHRVDRADRAGVGQARGGAGEIVDPEFAGASPVDEVLVGVPERGEVHVLRVLDARDEQLPGAVALLHVDRDAEPDAFVLDHGGLAVDLGVGHVHARHGLHGLDHGVADQVGEADLPLALAAQVVVDHHAVVDQQLRGDGPDAGGRRDAEAGLHVRDDARRGAAQHGGLLRLHLWRRRLGGDRLGFGRPGLCDLRLQRRGACRIGGDVIGEEVPPGGVDGVPILQVLLVEFVDEPFIRAECAVCVSGHGSPWGRFACRPQP